MKHRKNIETSTAHGAVRASAEAGLRRRPVNGPEDSLNSGDEKSIVDGFPTSTPETKGTDAH